MPYKSIEVFLQLQKFYLLYLCRLPAMQGLTD